MTQETRRIKIPYPSDGQDPYYPAFEAMVQTIDASVFGSVSNRNTLFFGGGRITWEGGVLSFSENIVFVEPTFGQRQILPAQADIVIPKGHFVYVELSRGNTQEVSLSAIVGSSIPVNSNAFVLSWRHPTTGVLYWKTGAKQVDGQEITNIGEVSSGSNSSYILAEADQSLPNSRVLTEGTTGTVLVTDQGALGGLNIDLATVPGVAGQYNLASLTINEYGQITSAQTFDPQVLNERAIDVTVEAGSGYFKVIQNTTGIRLGGPFEDGQIEVETPDPDDSSITHRFIGQTWVSLPVLTQKTMNLAMVYPFRIPSDAKDLSMSTHSARFRHYIKVSGEQSLTVVRYTIRIGSNTYAHNRAVGATDIIQDIPLTAFNSLPIEDHQGLSAFCEVSASNTLNAGADFEVVFGPLYLTFKNTEPTETTGQFQFISAQSSDQNVIEAGTELSPSVLSSANSN